MPPFLLLYIDFNPGFPVHQTVPADDIPIDALNLYVRTHIMGFATHLGPWLLGTVKNTTGTTAGTIRNLGATVVSQANTVAFGTLTGNLITVPAGAQMVSVTVVTTTVFSAATTLALSIGGTAFTTAATITTVGQHGLTANTTTPGGWLNVGSTDAIIAYTLVGTALTTGAATITVNYVVRNPDGSAFPTAFEQ